MQAGANGQIEARIDLRKSPDAGRMEAPKLPAWPQVSACSGNHQKWPRAHKMQKPSNGAAFEKVNDRLFLAEITAYAGSPFGLCRSKIRGLKPMLGEIVYKADYAPFP